MVLQLEPRVMPTWQTLRTGVGIGTLVAMAAHIEGAAEYQEAKNTSLL